jgi:hypothetical protein
VVFVFVMVLEGPHSPPPIVGCLAWFWFIAPQIPAADFSFSRSFIDLAGAVFLFGFFAVDVVPRERFHKSSKFAEVAGFAGVGEVVGFELPGPGERMPPCCREVGDMIEVLIL